MNHIFSVQLRETDETCDFPFHLEQFFHIQVLPFPFLLRKEILILRHALLCCHHAFQIDDVLVESVVANRTEGENLTVVVRMESKHGPTHHLTDSLTAFVSTQNVIERFFSIVIQVAELATGVALVLHGTTQHTGNRTMFPVSHHGENDLLEENVAVHR